MVSGDYCRPLTVLRYTPHCLKLVRKLYPTPSTPFIEFYPGNSQETMVAFLFDARNLGERFDVIHIDGGHDFWQVALARACLLCLQAERRTYAAETRHPAASDGLDSSSTPQ